MMTRGIKILGLAIAATLAMSALGASAAQATLCEGRCKLTGFETPSGTHVHTIVKGEQVGAATVFTPAEGAPSVTCSTATYEGTLGTGESASLTITPAYSGCHSVILGTTFNVDVRMNKCDYFFKVIQKTEADTYSGTTDVAGCEAGKPIEVEITNAEGKTKCLDTVDNQENIEPIVYHDKTTASPTDVLVTAEGHNVKNTTDQGILACGVEKGLHEKGSIVGEATIKGFNTNNEQIDLEVSGA